MGECLNKDRFEMEVVRDHLFGFNNMSEGRFSANTAWPAREGNHLSRNDRDSFANEL